MLAARQRSAQLSRATPATRRRDFRQPRLHSSRLFGDRDPAPYSTADTVRRDRHPSYHAVMRTLSGTAGEQSTLGDEAWAAPTTELPIYRMYGLRVASEIPLPIEPTGRGPADLTVTWGAAAPIPPASPPGEVIAQESDVERPSYTVTAGPDGYLLRFHGACDAAISADLRIVECRPDPTFDRSIVPILLAGTVAAFVLSESGYLVLHASVVSVGTTTLGFVGPSGSGKSTIAALCCAAGAAVLSDDLLALDWRGTPRCVGGWPELRLRHQAADIADLLPAAMTTRITADGRLAVRDRSDAADDPMLSALVVPRLGPPETDFDVSRLTGAHALGVVLAAARIEGWRRPTDLRRQFEASAVFARDVPVLVADIPWGLPFSAETARTLLTHVDRELSPR